MADRQHTTDAETLLPLDQIIAQAQLLLLREQIDPYDPSLHADCRRLVWALIPHVSLNKAEIEALHAKFVHLTSVSLQCPACEYVFTREDSEGERA
jgi:hypothetical protein